MEPTNLLEERSVASASQLKVKISSDEEFCQKTSVDARSGNGSGLAGEETGEGSGGGERRSGKGDKGGGGGGGGTEGALKTVQIKETMKHSTNSTPLPSQASQRLAESDKLEDQINLQHLVELMRIFHEADENGSDGLDIDEFRAAFGQILGEGKNEQQMAIMFMKIDTNCDGTVDWDEFCTYMLLEYQEKDSMNGERLPPFPYPLKMIASAHRESVSRIVFLPSISRGGGTGDTSTGSECEGEGAAEKERDGSIVTISRDGLICFWKSNMTLQRMVSVDHNRSKMMWVTDMAVMPNAHKMVLAFTDNMLAVYDLSTPAFEKQFQITALPYCALVLHHWFDEKDYNHSVLVFGDSGGGVCVMEFTRATRSLFGVLSSATQECHRIPFPELIHHKLSGMKSLYFSKAHSDWVDNVKYWQCTDSILSCSCDSNCSLLITSLTGRRESSVFQVKKGITSFDYSKDWNIIATGGVDRMLRLWNPYVVTKPISILKGHSTAILHVAINHMDGHILSFSKDLELRVWDIRDQLCLQACHRCQKIGHHVPYSFYFHPSSATLLIANNHLWALQQYREDSISSMEVVSHDKPLCGALYNVNFNQVVSACHGSVVSVWDLDTGDLTIQFSKCHGNMEITAMAFDPSGRRLATGGRDGSIKLWNFNNGACLSVLQTHYKAEVTSLCFLKQKIIAGGWSRHLSLYRDTRESDDVNPKYFGQGVHSEDILCMAHQNPNVLITASYDGNIVLWDTDVEQVVSSLNSTSGDGTSQQYRLYNRLCSTRRKRKRRGGGDEEEAHGGERGTATEPVYKNKLDKPVLSTPAQDTTNSSKFGYGDNTAVEQVLFLPGREQTTSTASLVAAGAGGMVQFWNIYGGGLLGQFNVFTAADNKPAWKKKEAELQSLHSITACKVDSSSSTLLTATSLGYLQIWDIRGYCVSVTGATPVMEPPHGQLCWRAHKKSVVSIDLAEDKALIVTASTDCCVCLWTMEGRYIGTFGEKQHWKLFHPVVSSGLPRKIPPGLHKAASFNTLQTIAGACQSKWKLARNLFKMLRRNRLHLKICKDESSMETDPDFDNLCSSEILGDTYQRKTRVRHPLPPAKLRFCDGYPVGIYSTLKCSELQDPAELQPQLCSQQQHQPKSHLRKCISEEDGERDGGKSGGEGGPRRLHTEKTLLPEMVPDPILCLH